tara:strand:- start:74 stop:595 length:522 start_codon:yes stop_codon:yes gene_type:complete
MPRKSREEYNKEYYAKNCDDILYRAKELRKDEKTIKCKCSEYGRYKDNTSARNAHFKTTSHRIWLKKQEIYELMTKQLNYSQLKAEAYVEDRLDKKKAKTPKDQLEVLKKYKMACIDGIQLKLDEENDPSNKVIVLEVEETQVAPTEKPYIPPSASFDPLALMGKSNNDIEGV